MQWCRVPQAAEQHALTLVIKTGIQYSISHSFAAAARSCADSIISVLRGGLKGFSCDHEAVVELRIALLPLLHAQRCMLWLCD